MFISTINLEFKFDSHPSQINFHVINFFLVVVPQIIDGVPTPPSIFSWKSPEHKVCCLSIFEGEGLKPGQVFSSTFIGITFKRNEIFSGCKFHNKEDIKGFNLI
jgi:hypothetical protein